MRRDLLLAITVAGTMLLSSCGSATKSLDMAEASVQQFHSQLDAQQYAAAYAATDEQFHHATTEPDFEKLLRSIHTKLGNVQGAKRQTWNVGWHTGQGATVTLVYDTKFAEGSGTEQFVWHIKDSQPTLYGYRINSNDLIEK